MQYFFQLDFIYFSYKNVLISTAIPSNRIGMKENTP